MLSQSIMGKFSFPASVTSSEGLTHAAGIMLTLMQQEDTDNTGWREVGRRVTQFNTITHSHMPEETQHA